MQYFKTLHLHPSPLPSLAQIKTETHHTHVQQQVRVHIHKLQAPTTPTLKTELLSCSLLNTDIASKKWQKITKKTSNMIKLLIKRWGWNRWGDYTWSCRSRKPEPWWKTSSTRPPHQTPSWNAAPLDPRACISRLQPLSTTLPSPDHFQNLFSIIIIFLILNW